MDQKPQANIDNGEPRVLGMVAEFDTPDALVEAARRVREEGYEHFDAHSPYPIHALDDAMKIRPTIIPWLVLGAGMTGTTIAVLMQWWTNAVDYPFIISGKPLFSLPANVPIMFELTVLLAALTAFFSNMALNKMGRPSNPLFSVDRFRGATAEKFFLSVEARGFKFDRVETKKFLEGLGAAAVEPIMETDAERSSKLPRPIVTTAIVLGSLALVPPAFVFGMRAGTFDKPRLHIVPDMDYQPKYKAQTANDFFGDMRSNRPPVEGTVAIGDLNLDTALHFGKNEDGDYVTEFPIPVNAETMARGEERYRITCVACHGESGTGDGMIAKRADLLAQRGVSGMSWVPPTSILDQPVQDQPIGQIFESITNGIRTMPAYSQQITPEDRWAIILYLKALQRAGSATMDQIPAAERQRLNAMPVEATDDETTEGEDE